MVCRGSRRISEQREQRGEADSSPHGAGSPGSPCRRRFLSRWQPGAQAPEDRSDRAHVQWGLEPRPDRMKTCLRKTALDEDSADSQLWFLPHAPPSALVLVSPDSVTGHTARLQHGPHTPPLSAQPPTTHPGGHWTGGSWPAASEGELAGFCVRISSPDSVIVGGAQ